jgi:hypothetical protein
MFERVKGWIHWWRIGRKAKKHLKMQIERYKTIGPAEPPTLEQIEAFKKEWDLGWDSHMVTKVETKKRYFEASLN